MDPITQIFQQAKAPSGSGNDLFDAYKFGSQQAQQTRQLNLEKRRLDLLEEGQQLTDTERGLDIQMKRDQLERNNQIKTGQAQALKLILEAGGTPGGWIKPETLQGAYDLATTYPELFGEGQIGRMLMGGIQSARAGANAINQLRELPGKVGELPLTSAEIDKSGNVISTFGNKGGSFDPLGPEKLELRKREIANAEKRQIDLEAQRKLSNFLRDRGMDQKDIDQAVKFQGLGVTVEPIPNAAGDIGANAYKVIQGPKPISPGEITKLQDQNQRIENSFQGVQRSLHAIEENPDAFGPFGVIKEYLEAALTLVDPTYDPRIRGARLTPDLAAEDIIKGLKQSGSMSDFEKKQLDSLVRVTGPLSTAARGKKSLEAIEFGLASVALHNAKLLKTAPPAWARPTYNKLLNLTPYDDEELLAAAEGGYITREQVTAEKARRKSRQK